MTMQYDYHVHSNYSDGAPLEEMVATGLEVGLEGIGIADHCIISTGEIRRDGAFEDRLEFADIEENLPQRREEIRALDDSYDLRVFDTVEIDYFRADEGNIASFIEAAEFDYVIGSIHFVDGIHFCNNGYFQSKSRAERRELIQLHLRDLVGLVESELFDIVGHIDVFERYPAFRGLVEHRDFRPLIEALRKSRTVPEINVGRLFGDYSDSNPRRDLVDFFVENGVEFTFGSDAHHPEAMERSVRYLRRVLEEEYDFVTLDI